MSKQKTEQHSHADWWGSVQNLNKKNANALKGVVRAVGCCVSFFCLLLLWDFWFFLASSCIFLNLPSAKKMVTHLGSQLFTVPQCSTEFVRMHGRF